MFDPDQIETHGFPYVHGVLPFAYSSIPLPESVSEARNAIAELRETFKDLEYQEELNAYDIKLGNIDPNSSENLSWEKSVIGKKRFIHNQIRLLNAWIQREKSVSNEILEKSLTEANKKINELEKKLNELSRRIEIQKNRNSDLSQNLNELKGGLESESVSRKRMQNSLDSVTSDLFSVKRFFARKLIELNSELSKEDSLSWVLKEVEKDSNYGKYLT